jgi:hypothetical protein
MPQAIIIIPGMLKPLRLAQIYGYLVEGKDGLYHPGGSQPACSMGLAQKMVEGGWLVKHGRRYEPTEKALQSAQ